MDSIIYICLAIFIFIVGLLVFLRSKTDSKYEVKNSDIVLGMLPIVLILLVSGKIESFEFGDLKVKAALVDASNKEISSQISPLQGIPVRELQSESKGAVSRIPVLIRNKTEALEFRLAHGGYYGPAIGEYFDALSRQSLLKYIIITRQDGTFFGMYDAGSLLAFFENEENRYSLDDFAYWLNQGNTEPLAEISGFIPAMEALLQNTNKSEALTAMEDKNLEILPVIDQDGYLQGIVDRSRLTASLILDVTKQLSTNTNSN